MSGDGYVCAYCGDDLCEHGMNQLVTCYEGKEGTALVDQAWLDGLLTRVQCLERQVHQLKTKLDEVTYGDDDSYF